MEKQVTELQKVLKFVSCRLQAQTETTLHAR
jgi:hypothetical protein